MPVALPEIRVGQAVRHEALTVFPLFTSQASGLEYLVSDEALEGGSVAVEEVSEAGSVPIALARSSSRPGKRARCPHERCQCSSRRTIRQRLNPVIGLMAKAV
jgi:hypothetical protein